MKKRKMKTSSKLLIGAGILLLVSMLASVIIMRVVFEQEMLPRMQVHGNLLPGNSRTL